MKINAFSKTYGERKVLDFPGLEIEKGKIYCILGSNGSGKSTFGQILAGVIKPDERGKVCDTKDIGYMPQKSFAFRMSTKANVLLGKKDEKKAAELMERLQLTHLAKKRADRLSGGETARMALARILMKDYDILILDEPSAAMDMETTIITEQIVKEFVEKTGCALIMVTHSIQQAERLADEIIYFKNGILIEQGPKEKVLKSPEKEETVKFLRFYGSNNS